VKSLTSQLSAECVGWNPYVKALQAHREELAQSTVVFEDEVVDSVASKLATRGAGGLGTLKTISVAAPSVEKENLLADCTRCDLERQVEFQMVLRVREQDVREGYRRVPSKCSERTPEGATQKGF